jgi:hypothetical protein
LLAPVTTATLSVSSRSMRDPLDHEACRYLHE